MPALAADLVRRQVDVIAAGSVVAAPASNAGSYNNAVQKVTKDEVTIRFGFGGLLLRSACLSPRCVYVRSAGSSSSLTMFRITRRQLIFHCDALEVFAEMLDPILRLQVA